MPGPVAFQHALRFAADVKSVGGGRLHAEGQLKGLDSGVQLRVARTRGLMPPVELLQKIDLLPLLLAPDAVVAVDVL